MNDLRQISKEKGPSFYGDGHKREAKLVTSSWSCSLLRVGLVAVFMIAGCHEEDSPAPDNLPPEKIESVPTIALTNLSRGAFVVDDATDMPITISGEVCDSINAITSVTINGTAVTPEGSDDCKTFTTELNSPWGMNIVDVVVENADGDELSLVQSFIRSPEYFPADGTSGNPRIDGAWRGRLGQSVLDDQDRNDLDDIASVMELAMNNFNFDESLPAIIYISGDGNGDGQVDLITSDCWPLKDVTTHKTGARVARNGNFNVGSIAINYLRVFNERLEFKVTARNMSQNLIANAYLNLACIPPNEIVTTTTGKIEVSSLEISGQLGIEIMEGGIAKITSDNIDTRVTGLELTIDNSGVIDNLINLIAAAFNRQIENLFANTFFDDNIKGVLGEVVNGFTISPTIDVPAPVSVQLNIDSDLDYARFGAEGFPNLGYIDVGFAARVFPSEFKKEATLLDHGSILGVSTSPSFSDSHALGLGMKDDFINQIFWAVWAGGGFDLSGDNSGLITDLLGSSGLDVSFLSVETGLPPVLMPGGEGSEVKIGVGDVLMRMKINPILLGRPASGNEVEVSFYASLMLTGTLDIDPETREIGFTLSTEPEVHVQLVDFARTDETVDLESKIGRFASNLIQRLVSDVLSAIELPSIPLSNVEGAPVGTKWVLDNGRTDHEGGYFRIIGEIGVE